MCTPVAGLFDSMGSITFDSTLNRFQFTYTTVPPTVGSSALAQFNGKLQLATEDR